MRGCRGCSRRSACRPRRLDGFWHAFSGGQRQRIGIACALAVEPECLTADEIVFALDVSGQAQIINLPITLQKRLSLVVFVFHHLHLVRYLAHRVAVMYRGRMVESGLADAARHPTLRRSSPPLRAVTSPGAPRLTLSRAKCQARSGSPPGARSAHVAHARSNAACTKSRTTELPVNIAQPATLLRHGGEFCYARFSASIMPFLRSNPSMSRACMPSTRRGLRSYTNPISCRPHDISPTTSDIPSRAPESKTNGGARR